MANSNAGLDHHWIEDTPSSSQNETLKVPQKATFVVMARDLQHHTESLLSNGGLFSPFIFQMTP